MAGALPQAVHAGRPPLRLAHRPRCSTARQQYAQQQYAPPSSDKPVPALGCCAPPLSALRAHLERQRNVGAYLRVCPGYDGVICTGRDSKGWTGCRRPAGEQERKRAGIKGSRTGRAAEGHGWDPEWALQRRQVAATAPMLRCLLPCLLHCLLRHCHAGSPASCRRRHCMCCKCHVEWRQLRSSLKAAAGWRPSQTVAVAAISWGVCTPGAAAAACHPALPAAPAHMLACPAMMLPRLPHAAGC